MATKCIKRMKLRTIREKKLDYYNCWNCGSAVLGKANKDNRSLCNQCKVMDDKGHIPFGPVRY